MGCNTSRVTQLYDYMQHLCHDTFTNQYIVIYAQWLVNAWVPQYKRIFIDIRHAYEYERIVCPNQAAKTAQTPRSPKPPRPPRARARANGKSVCQPVSLSVCPSVMSHHITSRWSNNVMCFMFLMSSTIGSKLHHVLGLKHKLILQLVQCRRIQIYTKRCLLWDVQVVICRL